MGSKGWTDGQKPKKEKHAQTPRDTGADHDQKDASATCIIPRMLHLKGKGIMGVA